MGQSAAGRVVEVAVCVLCLVAAGSAAPAADGRGAAPSHWPQLEGPGRDNMSADTGLLKRWPAGGPELLWRAKGLGGGWAAVAIANGRLHTAGKVDKNTVITTLDLSGRRLWRVTTGAAFTGYSPGARGTPTIVGGKLYHLNGTGHVVCLDAATGRRIWAVNILRQYRGRNVRWGLAESLLVTGSRVFCYPGGERVSMVALDAATGKTVWTCTGVGDEPGYVSPRLVEYGGLRQIITITAKSVIGVSAESGKLLWRYPHAVKYAANCTTPIIRDGHVFVFGTWGFGATCLKLNVQGEACSVTRLWHTEELDNEHGGVVALGGYLYGQADGDHKKRHLACLDARTGKTMWTTGELAGKKSATLTCADGMLYLMSDVGEVALVRPNPSRLDVVSRFDLPKGGKGPTYARPVVCGGRLYVRHDEHLYVYALRAP